MDVVFNGIEFFVEGIEDSVWAYDDGVKSSQVFPPAVGDMVSLPKGIREEYSLPAIMRVYLVSHSYGERYTSTTRPVILHCVLVYLVPSKD